MKNLLRFTLTFAGACAVLPAVGLFAQAPSPSVSATPSVSVPAGPTSSATAGGAQAGQGRGQRLRESLATLTPEERQELKTAHEKALADPAVKTAEAQRASDPQAFRRTVFEAMLRADPNVGPILKKMRAANAPGSGLRM